MKLKTTRKPRATRLKPTALEFIPMQPEFNLRKILVPVDFSESSRKAVHYAISFARQFNSEIMLLHVATPVLPVVPDLMGGVTPIGVESPSLAEKKQLAEWRRGIDPSIQVRTEIRKGIPSQDIIEAAEEHNIDLIILGRRGRTGLAHLLLGGTAEYVLRHAPCPALVVRESEHDFIADEPRTRRAHRDLARH